MSDITAMADKMVDFERVRADFPVLQEQFYDKSLVYLDSGATTQKPQCVIGAITQYYQAENANVHRGVYALSEKSTAAFESVRHSVMQFINAKSTHEIVFTKGATASINLIANAFARSELKAGDEVLITHMEHHSNIVPWQVACEQTGAVLKVVPVDDEGVLDLEAYEALLTDRTKIVGVIHISNVLGTINPIKQMIAQAHAKNIPVLVDGAQAAPHIAVDVQDLDCDFYAFSSHKMYGPTGVGVLYGKEAWLQRLPPYQTGGDMIRSVSFDKTEYNVLPYKFEAGTPNVAGVVGFGEAINYLERIGFDAIVKHEQALLAYATKALKQVPGLRIIGNAPDKAGVISFVMDNVHAHDIGTILDHEAIAVRAGHHCAMPLMERFALAATVRASFGVYNNVADVDRLVAGLEKVYELFSE